MGILYPKPLSNTYNRTNLADILDNLVMDINKNLTLPGYLTFNNTVTGLSWDPTTNILSLTTSYVIPTTTEETNWNTAYGWGNHALVGYLTSLAGAVLLSPPGAASQTINGDLVISNATPRTLSSDKLVINTNTLQVNTSSTNFNYLGVGAVFDTPYLNIHYQLLTVDYPMFYVQYTSPTDQLITSNVNHLFNAKVQFASATNYLNQYDANTIRIFDYAFTKRLYLGASTPDYNFYPDSNGVTLDTSSAGADDLGLSASKFSIFGTGTGANKRTIFKGGINVSDIEYTLPRALPASLSGNFRCTTGGVLTWDETVYVTGTPWTGMGYLTSVAYANMPDIISNVEGKVLGRLHSADGVVGELTAANLKTMCGYLTSVAYANMPNIAQYSILGRVGAGSGVIAEITSANEGKFLRDDLTWQTAGGGSSDHKVSANTVDDTTPDYLYGKLVAGTGIDISATSGAVNQKVTISSTVGADGWVTTTGTWSFSSDDTPTFVISVNNDQTAIISIGMRIRISQATGGTKYFIVTAVGTYGSGVTLITVYGGTDYTLVNEAISSPVYSTMKSPFGFPMSPTKWQVVITDNTNRQQAGATPGTWYNLGGANSQISVPIGAWQLSYKVNMYMQDYSTTQMWVTLSPVSGSDGTDNGWYSRMYLNTYQLDKVESKYVENPVLLTSKTLYYLNAMTAVASSNLNYDNSEGIMVLRARCAYL